MDKALFFNTLIDTLRRELLDAVNASKDAADYATNEESKAESQWDTQGLEASYLAAGQASQARQWAKAIEDLQSDREALLRPSRMIALGALFSVEIEGEEGWFFFARVAGGQVVPVEGREVTVLTTQSPLAGQLRNLKAGDSFYLNNGALGQVTAVE